MIGADWKEFGETDWQSIGTVAPAAVVYDCRCSLDPQVIKAAGLGYYRPGYGQSGAGAHNGIHPAPVAAGPSGALNGNQS